MIQNASYDGENGEYMYDKNIEKVLISEEMIKQRTQELAKKISDDYRGKRLIMVCVLTGAMVFFADLIRQIDIPVEVDTIVASSYGAGMTTSGSVRISKDIKYDISGKHVILVEDIIDTGVTLKTLTKMLATRAPESLKVCSLLDKPSRRKVDFEGDYVGFKIPDEFVVGYGLDYAEKYRNLPEVCVYRTQQEN